MMAPLFKSTRAAGFSIDFMKLEMPALSPTMAEGTIAVWCKKEGDRVDVGDVVCEITTDKATVGYESQEEGYIAKILSPEGGTSPIGGLIGIMVEEQEDIAKLDLSAIQSAHEPVKADNKEELKAEVKGATAAESASA